MPSSESSANTFWNQRLLRLRVTSSSPSPRHYSTISWRDRGPSAYVGAPSNEPTFSQGSSCSPLLVTLPCLSLCYGAHVFLTCSAPVLVVYAEWVESFCMTTLHMSEDNFYGVFFQVFFQLNNSPEL